VTVASEKGGVGKTTIATNLAVYLKALREDLPVTIASFDNHFSIDKMFALGPRPSRSMAELDGKVPLGELVNLGQYGVQYIASSRRLERATDDSAWLESRLHESGLEGVVILDTRPILDSFTESALLAAELVLTPIKDRAALVNAEALREVLAGVGREQRLWLLPSLVDSRARLNAEVRLHEFLTFSARERDYQVLNLLISKSPKVEGLASGFSSRIRPVLTHARNTAVHMQFRRLAEHVLELRDRCEQSQGLEQGKRDPAAAATGSGPHSLRPLLSQCPCCNEVLTRGPAHPVTDYRGRRGAFIHTACLEELLLQTELADEVLDGPLALVVHGPGRLEPECRPRLYRCRDGELPMALGGSEQLGEELLRLAEQLLGRGRDSFYRELILLGGEAVAVSDSLPEGFSRQRRRAVRMLGDAELL
jgi:cellulose biosynthesis protein BcsQ